MRYVLTVIMLLFAFVAGCTQQGGSSDTDGFVARIVRDYPELKDKDYEIAVVGRIVDGDTFETEDGRKVRLIGVNTPEVHGKVEDYGREASAFSKARLQNQTVYLFRDVSDTDRYGRLLRYIFVEHDPVLYNETLLTEGYANTMTYPPDVLFADKFAHLERAARESGKGLWGEKEPLEQPEASCDRPQIKGNINSRNEKIYHTPDSPQYKQTKAEMMFCTEEEAANAGFRKAHQ